MTTSETAPRRRIRAALIGLGFDGQDGQHRILTGTHCVVVGGSAETHAEMVETMRRLEFELDRRGQPLGDLDPNELADLAALIDSPELRQIADRLDVKLEFLGQSFHDSTAEELTELASA